MNARKHDERWNFPNCIGSMDAKHIEIKQPKNSGSYCFNYKGRFNIVLLALMDANCKFIYADVGCNGRMSDGGVFRNSTLSKAISTNILNIPEPRTLDDGEIEAPYVIVADDAFPLMENLMKPYHFRGLCKEQRICNYHLSRARRIVENVFGVLANRFRIFLSPILLSPDNVEILTLACCTLHSFLRDKAPLRYTPPGSFDVENLGRGQLQHGDWRSGLSSQEGGLRSVKVVGSNNYKSTAKEMREKFCYYFNTLYGAVPWQDKFI